MQCFLKLVSQLVPLGRTRLRLKAYFYLLIAQNIARQVARGVLHCAILQKSVAALPKSLRKVEFDSTSCNACCNKNVARLDHWGICYTMQFLVQLVSAQQNCETSCTKNCIVQHRLNCYHTCVGAGGHGFDSFLGQTTTQTLEQKVLPLQKMHGIWLSGLLG